MRPIAAVPGWRALVSIVAMLLTAPALAGERGEIAEEGEAAGRVQRGEAVEKEAAEQPREDAHRQEEAGLRRSSASRPATGRRRER